MIENLRLDNTAELTAANTNNSALPLINTDGTTSNHLSPSTDPTQTAWCTNYNAVCMDKSMLAANNIISFTSNIASSYDITSNVYSYGNYYNWYSATAGNGTYSIADNQSVTGSICPSGWKLPTGGNVSNKANSDFWKLSVDAIGAEPSNSNYYEGAEGTTDSKAMRAYPNIFICSGDVGGSSLDNRDLYGNYWASTATSMYYTYDFVLNDDYVYPGSIFSIKNFGISARCLANI